MNSLKRILLEKEFVLASLSSYRTAGKLMKHVLAHNILYLQPNIILIVNIDIEINVRDGYIKPELH